jgi:hypothetical protein
MPRHRAYRPERWAARYALAIAVQLVALGLGTLVTVLLLRWG